MIKSVMVDGAEALKLMLDGTVAWERSGLPSGYQRLSEIYIPKNKTITLKAYDLSCLEYFKFSADAKFDGITGTRQLIGLSSMFFGMNAKGYSDNTPSVYIADGEYHHFTCIAYPKNNEITKIFITDGYERRFRSSYFPYSDFILGGIPEGFLAGGVFIKNLEINGEIFIPAIRQSDGKNGFISNSGYKFYS